MGDRALEGRGWWRRQRPTQRRRWGEEEQRPGSGWVPGGWGPGQVVWGLGEGGGEGDGACACGCG